MPIAEPIDLQEKKINNLALVKTLKGLSEKPKTFEEALDEYGAAPPDIARVVAAILNYSEHDSNKLKAAQLIADWRNLGGDKSGNTVIFNINGENVNLNNLFVPGE